MVNDPGIPRLKIPPNITRDHIIQAIREIDKNGYPDKNESRKYNLLFEGKYYPPKVVLSIANRNANGELLDVSDFSGGEQFANKFLKERGFEIILKDDPLVDFEYESHSWKIISDTVATKQMDKSSFKHHGTGIPVDIRKFFGIDTMNVGERREITLIQGILRYPAHFEMVNRKNPRTRLLWRIDLESYIRTTFPKWAENFEKDTKPQTSTPVMKFTKTNSKDNYSISFEEKRLSSQALAVNAVYSREDLKKQFSITDASIKNGIFKPKDFSSVWLFVTEEKTPDRTQYKDFFDGFSLQFEGQTMARTDSLIYNHEADENEILVFYRKKKGEFANYGFTYLGRFRYQSHTPGKAPLEPTKFIFYPLDIATDEDKDVWVVADKSYKPMVEGKERTRIQTYYERNPGLRSQAIAIHGTKCVVCGFDFGKQYGPYGEGYIEIHHLIPHSAIKGEHGVDPKTDLVPVCSNCHRMIHRPQGTWLTIDQLKKILK